MGYVEVAAIPNRLQKGENERVNGGEVCEADGNNRVIDIEVGEEAIH